jgi:serine protease
MKTPNRRARRAAFGLLAPLALCIATVHAQPATVDVAGLAAETSHRQFLVTYKSSATTVAHAQARLSSAMTVARSRQGALASVTPTVLRQIGTGAHVVRTSAPLSRTAAEALMRAIGEDPDVRHVEIDHVMRPAYFVPNDTFFTEQHNLWGPAGVNAHLAWPMTKGEHTIVAVVDSGFTPHPDLAGRMYAGYDFVDQDNNPHIAACGEGGSHGTKVAGVVAAVQNNARGVSGVAPGAMILPVRALGGCGESGYMSDTIQAILWASGEHVGLAHATLDKAHVINLSLGAAAKCSYSMQEAIDKVVAKGVVVVAAAGNSNVDAGTFSPAGCENVITVGGTTVLGMRDPRSNWGAAVDVAAPNYVVWSEPDNSRLVKTEGTSFAAPHVSAIAALVQSAVSKPLSPSRVEDIIALVAESFPGDGLDRPLGAGYASAPAAVSAARASVPGQVRLQGAYTLVARPAHVSGPLFEACMIAPTSGTREPILYDWQKPGGARQHCGWRNEAELLGQMEGVWDIQAVTTSHGVTAHVIRSRVNGKCLIRGHNGYATYADLYLWGQNPDKMFCGFASADELVDNGQAAWFLEDPVWRTRGNVETVVTGLKTIQPTHGFLGFEAQRKDAGNTLQDLRNWVFEAWPVQGTTTRTGRYRVWNAAIGRCLDVQGERYWGGTLIDYPCSGAANQQFWVQGAQIVVGGGEYCLDVAEGRAFTGAYVISYRCHGGENQLWTVDDEGKVRSLIPGTQYCIDTAVDGGWDMRLSPCVNGRASQKFRFDPV